MRHTRAQGGSPAHLRATAGKRKPEESDNIGGKAPVDYEHAVVVLVILVVLVALVVLVVRV